MRFLKIILVILLVMTLVSTTVFYSRSSVVISIVNDHLAEHNSALTCIDFELNTDFNLMISRLCIDSPYADIELIDSLITWRLDPKDIEVNDLSLINMSEIISSIDIALINVKAKKDFKYPTSTAPIIEENSTLELNKLPALIRQKLHNLAAYSTPVEIDIKSFNYHQFTDENENDELNNKAKPSYHGYFSASPQQIDFSLANQKHEDILSFDQIKNGQDISANVVTDLARLRLLLLEHQVSLPSSFSSLLVDEILSITGVVNSHISWNKQVLSVNNKLTDLSFETVKKSSLLKSIELSKTFEWQTNLTGDVLHFDFGHHANKVNKVNKGNTSRADSEDNNVQILLNSQELIESLLAQTIDSQIIKFLEDNPINNLKVKPLGSVKIDFSQQKIITDGINITSQNLNAPINLSLSDLSFDYEDEGEDELAIAVNLNKAKFSMASQVKVAQLQSYSQSLVKLNVVGNVEQYDGTLQVNIAQGSVVELSDLSLPLANSKVNKVVKSPEITTKKHQVQKNKLQASVKSLISNWQGNIIIATNAEPNTKSQKIKNEPIIFDLVINNQISQLNYPEIIQVNTLDLNATLVGTLDNITLKSEVITDKVPITEIQITGDILQPTVTMSAKNVLLTDALALNIKLPVELKLIDGTVDYHLTGQLKNSKNLMANPMTLAIVVKDVTGDIDGTWLQELNWQQNFILQNGEIRSIRDKTETLYNLTIAKIEAAIPINNLATRIDINFSSDIINLAVYGTSGNLLGGRFEIEQAQWPLSQKLPMKLKLTKIDLEKLLELDEKQGIVITGKVSGELPIYYDGENFLIKDGQLHNVGDGIIQVHNNPAVEALKESGTEIKLAFNALENLHYHHLSSEASMADDGYMLLITAIKGRNPDLDNDVNFNLNLNYDLLGLLESMNITEYFENKVVKGLQKN